LLTNVVTFSQQHGTSKSPSSSKEIVFKNICVCGR
jgi:hypothetical protein